MRIPGQAMTRALAGIDGLSGSSGIPPGNSCYDATHDVGEIHCADLGDVIWGAFGGAPATTSCSTSETACLASNPGAVSSVDVCAANIGVSCTWVIFGLAALATIGILVAKK